MVHLTNVLKQMFRARDGEGMSTQPDEEPPTGQRLQCRSKWHYFGPFFFCKQCMKRRHFKQNAPFHLKEKGGKMC